MQNYRVLEEKWSNDDVIFIPQYKTLFGWKSFKRQIGHETYYEETFNTLDDAKNFIAEYIEEKNNPLKIVEKRIHDV